MPRLVGKRGRAASRRRSRLIGPAIATAFLIAAADPARSQEGPAYDCGEARSEVEVLICGDPGLAALDRRLAGRFGSALAATRALDAGASEAEDVLRATQRGWIGGRDACWQANDVRDCVEAAYLRREGALVALWLLEDPSGTAAWRCEDRSEVVTVFFDTALPSVRIERGDVVDVASLAPAASGSRYEGSFGRSIWIRGEAARYREADPDGSEYRCSLERAN